MVRLGDWGRDRAGGLSTSHGLLGTSRASALLFQLIGRAMSQIVLLRTCSMNFLPLTVQMTVSLPPCSLTGKAPL